MFLVAVRGPQIQRGRIIHRGMLAKIKIHLRTTAVTLKVGRFRRNSSLRAVCDTPIARVNI